MKYGFTLPQGDARTAAALAREAEIAGWDGFFVWEPVWGIDPWVSLAAAAMVTQHIRLGTMVTPVSRRRPWKLASETATLDHLSGGRVILSVGLGAIDTGFAAFGEETDRRQRAQLLDEGLAIVTGLWQGQPFSFSGTHYRVQPTEFMPPPPDMYYKMSHKRVEGHTEPLDRMKKNGILIDGEGVVDGGETRILLQVFSKTVIGPIFFEFIQRKGDDGFGEGNFKALFESIERDQIERGVIDDTAAK